MDEFIEYLFVTGQLDDTLCLKEPEDDDEEIEPED